MLYSKYKASDYVLEAYGKQLSGRVFGIGARVASSTSLYSLNLYGDLDSTNNLYLYRWSGTSAATLKSAAVGQVNASTWYKLSLKVHGSTIELYKDGALKGQATDSQIASGGVALYGESGTVAEFNNVIVRKYAAQEPAATVGAANAQGLSSLSISPATVVGGTPASGTVMLASVAPPGGAMVLLSSSGPQTASPPASVLVPAGASSAAFSVSTNAVLASQTVSISAQYGGVSRSAV
jgi:hypothetical protein